DTGLASGGETLRDMRAECGEALLNDGILIRIQWINERRHHEPCPTLPHLVHVEHSLRMLLIMESDIMPRLGLRHHKPVAIIVMPGVRMIQERQIRPDMNRSHDTVI